MASEQFADLSKIRLEMIKEKTEQGLEVFKKNPNVQWTNLRFEKPLLEELLNLVGEELAYREEI